MRVIGVEEYRSAMFFPHDFYQGCEFVCPEKTSFSLRCADHHRNSDLSGGCHNRFEQNQIGNVEMTERRALLLQGATEAPLSTVSYGAERPAVAGHDEAAWSKNRRVEIVYLTPTNQPAR